MYILHYVYTGFFPPKMRPKEDMTTLRLWVLSCFIIYPCWSCEVRKFENRVHTLRGNAEGGKGPGLWSHC